MNPIQKQINNEIDTKYDISQYKTVHIETMIKNTVDIKCKQCGSDNVNVYTYQSRSSDEASSKYYTCLNCGIKWRVG